MTITDTMIADIEANHSVGDLSGLANLVSAAEDLMRSGKIIRRSLENLGTSDALQVLALTVYAKLIWDQHRPAVTEDP